MIWISLQAFKPQQFCSVFIDCSFSQSSARYLSTTLVGDQSTFGSLAHGTMLGDNVFKTTVMYFLHNSINQVITTAIFFVNVSTAFWRVGFPGNWIQLVCFRRHCLSHRAAGYTHLGHDSSVTCGWYVVDSQRWYSGRCSWNVVVSRIPVLAAVWVVILHVV